jgi:hypothetical protein
MNESSAEVGRAAETERVDALLDHLRQGGAAHVIRGDPGIGKSALLQHAGERAGDLGAAVLTTIGTESEAELAFAGLYALLRPVINRMGSLRPTCEGTWPGSRSPGREGVAMLDFRAR